MAKEGLYFSGSFIEPGSSDYTFLMNRCLPIDSRDSEIVVELMGEIPQMEDLQDMLNAKYSFENLKIRSVITVNELD